MKFSAVVCGAQWPVRTFDAKPHFDVVAEVAVEEYHAHLDQSETRLTRS